MAKIGQSSQHKFAQNELVDAVVNAKLTDGEYQIDVFWTTESENIWISKLLDRSIGQAQKEQYNKDEFIELLKKNTLEKGRYRLIISKNENSELYKINRIQKTWIQKEDIKSK